MAIYHMSISNVSRAKGSSACASLAYIAASKVYEERTHQTYSYGRHERVEKVATLLPDGAPSEYADAAQLFNAIENYEQSANARTAKKIVVALPRELSLKASDEILTDFINGKLCANGYCATYAIHNDKDGNNPHAHILVANRPLDRKTGDFARTKSKKVYVVDVNGERVPLIDKKTGMQKVDKQNRKQWKRMTIEQKNLLDEKDFLLELRKGWADECNKHLSPAKQIDHRSNVARGIEDIPTIHEGYAAHAMEARGELSERMEINREIRRKNDLIHKLIEALMERPKRVNEVLNQIYAAAKKWLTHTAAHEVVTPPEPPAPKTQPVMPPATLPVVEQIHSQHIIVEEPAPVNTEELEHVATPGDIFMATLDNAEIRAHQENKGHSRNKPKSRDIER